MPAVAALLDPVCCQDSTGGSGSINGPGDGAQSAEAERILRTGRNRLNCPTCRHATSRCTDPLSVASDSLVNAAGVPSAPTARCSAPTRQPAAFGPRLQDPAHYGHTWRPASDRSSLPLRHVADPSLGQSHATSATPGTVWSVRCEGRCDA